MIKVLMIEDDEDQILMYKTKFLMEGFAFVATREGSVGVAKAKAEKPDIILADVLMYEMPGTDVLRALKADPETRGIPVVMLTNLSKRETAQECMDLGAAEYLVKTDIEPAQLVERVRRILARQ